MFGWTIRRTAAVKAHARAIEDALTAAERTLKSAEKAVGTNGLRPHKVAMARLHNALAAAGAALGPEVAPQTGGLPKPEDQE